MSREMRVAKEWRGRQKHVHVNKNKLRIMAQLCDQATSEVQHMVNTMPRSGSRGQYFFGQVHSF